MTIYTSSSGLKKEGKGEGKKYTHGEWVVHSQLIGLIGGNGMNAGVRWPRSKERGRRKSPPTITLPSSDSFERSQPAL